MTALKPNQNQNKNENNNLFKDYPWFYSNIYQKVQDSTDEFFQKDFKLRLMSITREENLLFYGDEYFVNKIPVTKMSDIKIRISASMVSALLDNSLGVSDNLFSLKNLTDIEAMLIKSYTVNIYKNLEDCLNKAEVNKKVVESAKNYDLTMYMQSNGQHNGKIIITIPEYMLKNIEVQEKSDRFNVEDFEDVNVIMNVIAGTSKITLNEIKAIEEGDIILLENSNINEMSVLWQEKRVPFRINPNPSLIISIENNGGNHMEDETNAKSQNMWDSILVDIVAEFDNVKLTLGELKQISEGLVIDLGSVYENKIKLRVENQVVATGELVILNDRYGVRVNNITKSSDNKSSIEKSEVKNKQASRPVNSQGKNENENFDYSDFEIEDESI